MIILIKSHVKPYTKKSGTFVSAHETKVVKKQTEKKKPEQKKLPEPEGYYDIVHKGGSDDYEGDDGGEGNNYPAEYSASYIGPEEEGEYMSGGESLAYRKSYEDCKYAVHAHAKMSGFKAYAITGYPHNKIYGVGGEFLGEG